VRTLAARLSEQQVQRRDSLDDFAKLWKSNREGDHGLTPAGVSRPYRNHAWVYSAVSAIARNVAQVPYRLYADDDRQHELPKDHWANNLFDRPNLLTRGYDLWYGTECYLNLTGGALWVPVPAQKAGALAEIWVFSQREITPRISNGNFMGWQVKWAGKDLDFEADEVLFFRYFNPYHPVLGMAPMEAARLAIDQDWWANKYNEAFFKNFAEPGIVITFEGEPSDAVITQSRESWEARHQGFGNAKKTAVLWGGAKISELGMSKRDMQFIEQMKMSREQILSVFHVPPVEVMLVDQVSSRVESQRAQRTLFGEEVIAPELKMLEDTVNAWFQYQKIPVWGFFDTSEISILQESLADKISKAKELFGMLVPFNEINRKLDLGFADLPWGDVAFIQQSMVPVTQLIGETPDDEPGPDDDDGGDEALHTPAEPVTLARQDFAELPLQPDTLRFPPQSESSDGVSTASASRATSASVARPFSPRRSQQSQKLRRLLFELRNALLNEKDGGEKVCWPALEKRLEGIVRDPEGFVTRLRQWAERAAKSEVKRVHNALRAHAEVLADAEPFQIETIDNDDYWRQYEREIQPIEKEMEGRMLRYFRELEDEYLAVFRTRYADLLAEYRRGDTESTELQLQTDTLQFSPQRETGFDWENADLKIEQAARPAIEKGIKKFGQCELLTPNIKAQRAKATHKPCNRSVRQKAEAEARKVAQTLGGVHTEDNEPMDILIGNKHGVEVKTFINQTNDKITMHPESLRRKREFIRKHKLKGHTVAVDAREGRRQLYYAQGFGSFRLSSMDAVTEQELLMKILGRTKL